MSSVPSSPAAPGTPGSTTSILTPTRKVEALLAQFDDSDSDDGVPARTQPASNLESLPESGPVSTASEASQARLEESDDDDILIPRRQTNVQDVSNDSSIQAGQAQKEATPTLDSGSEKSRKVASWDDSDEEDILSRRRPTTERPTVTSPARSPSPLFFPSPADRKSKFLTLVEKHRKARIQKEAEEVVKQAARKERQKAEEVNRRPRGSSPADDTEEDSDHSEGAGGKRLSKQARPTRKASKKAIEEMKRETQRISRGMQLAHQARTKKRITKDSLLARFNFPVTTSTAAHDHDAASASSPRDSDDEPDKLRDTPPTSPLSDSVNHDKPSTAPIIDKGKGRALSVEPVEERVQAYRVKIPSSEDVIEQQPKPTMRPSTAPPSTKRSLLAMTKKDSDESDSDLEIVTSRGDMRKYAAFERLPAKKAKETSSHIALRSLANLIGAERQRSVNAAGIEASLRKAARLQARAERQQRIEELKAKGVVIQTAEERENEQQEVEDLLERARQEAVDIHQREKARAKKDGTYVKDGMDDEDDSDDGDFVEEAHGSANEDVDEETEEGEEGDSDAQTAEDDEEDGPEDEEKAEGNLLDNEADEEASDDSAETEDIEIEEAVDEVEAAEPTETLGRKSRTQRIVSDDEDDELPKVTTRSPQLPAPAKTPQSLSRSAKKQIPGLAMSDDLPIGLTQAFAATMADSQSQDEPATQEQDSLEMTADLPSPNIAMAPRLYRQESIDVISDSQPASQTQPLNVNLSSTQSQRVPQSPALHMHHSGVDITPSQPHFEPTQDADYMLSPFMGNRFAAETPQQQAPQSTVDTLILPDDLQESPIVQRKNRLRRGRVTADDSDDEAPEPKNASAFDVMQRAAARKPQKALNKDKSAAKAAFDEAAEESEDEYAGLGGASDDDGNDEENDDDRRMIDEDTQVGVNDGAKLAKLYADREREQDEAAVSKLLKDITTGALRRKRGNDDLDLSDEEDAVVRRREAKRREFAKMRRELLKDEAVGKIAEDKKKEAFLRSIEDRAESEEDEDDFDQPETQVEDESQAKGSQPREAAEGGHISQAATGVDDGPLTTVPASRLNLSKQSSRRSTVPLNKRPGTLAEIRDSVSFLIEEPDSQSMLVDLGLSDSEDEPEAYVDLDRHFASAEADENTQDVDDLGDFIVDDDGLAKDDEPVDERFKKPALPGTGGERAPFSERRTQPKDKSNVVNRLSLLRQSSSSASNTSTSTKMAFYTSASAGTSNGFHKVPTLLRRATTNSSLGSMASAHETTSATGVTSRTERGSVSDEKEFVRKGSGGRRNAVNYRPTVREEKMRERAGVKKNAKKNKSKKGGFLGGLFEGGSWN